MVDFRSVSLGRLLGVSLFVLGFLVAFGGLRIGVEEPMGACCVPTGLLLMLGAIFVGSILIGMGWGLSVDWPAHALGVLVIVVALYVAALAGGPVLADRPDRWLFFFSRFFLGPAAVALVAWGVARDLRSSQTGSTTNQAT